MTPTIPRTFLRRSDGAYPIPDWQSPDPETHVEVMVEPPPEVPPGYRAVLADQPDAEHVLRYRLEPIPVEELRAQRLAELAALRYVHETRGVTVDGLPMQTSREAQASLAHAYMAAQTGLRADGAAWKCADGAHRPLSNAALQALAGAVMRHVQACFDREAGLAGLIRASESPLEVEISQGWPE